ncbi:MAG: replication-relaxation family protein [Tepidisphaeraceae bacterium]
MGSDARIELQPRDVAVLVGLFESRLMTLAHVAALFFDDKAEYAKKRVQRLKAAGYLVERPRRAYDPSILHLTPHAIAFLRREGLLDRFPRLPAASYAKRTQVSDLTLVHERQVMDVKTAIVRAVRGDPSLAIEEFSTWPRLNEFAAQGSRGDRIVVRPDGFIRLGMTTPHERVEHTFYIEVDRGSEVLDTLVNRAAAYLDHYRSGGLAVRFGASASHYKEYPFRVLIVVPTDARRNNLATRLLKNDPPIRQLVWMTTFEDVIRDPLGHIWLAPADFDEANVGNRSKRLLLA